MSKDYDKPSGEVEWNLSQALIISISQLLDRASRLFLAGDLINSFWSYREAKFQMIPSLNEEERTNMNNLEDQFLIKRKRTRLMTKEEYKRRLNQASQIYETYRVNLMDLLKKYGFYISPKKDKTSIN
ncbi:hypothetical protein J4462_04020 [Candidatus Pacearchaeota archaeon]|nr:hypothetical protein [Candidatus Pacearchaeota archaeon]